MSRKIGMISLGCPKNQVDAEIMLKKLVDAGYVLVQDADKADIVIVNLGTNDASYCSGSATRRSEFVSSYTELLMSEAIGVVGHDIMFSSNVTPEEDFKKASGKRKFLLKKQLISMRQDQYVIKNAYQLYF